MEGIHQQFNALVCELVFPYLNQQDLMSASKVCKTWNDMASDKLLWKTIKLNNLRVVHWEKLVNLIIKRETHCLDTRNMLIPETKYEFDNFWNHFSYSIRKAVDLKCIYLYKCPSNVLEAVIKHLFNLEVLDALLMKKFTPMDIFYGIVHIRLDVRYLCNMKNLTELRIRSKNTLLFGYAPLFARLPNLKTLDITSNGIKNVFVHNYDICHRLPNLNTSLMRLEISDCSCKLYSHDINVFLKLCLNLKCLKLQFSGVEDYFTLGNDARDTKVLMNTIMNLKNLECLELVNIWNSLIEVEDFKLEKCDNLKKLYIELSSCKNACHINHFLIKLFNTLRNKLTNLEVGFQPMSTCEMCILSVDLRCNINSVPIQDITLQILDGHEPNLNGVTDRNIIYVTKSELKMKLKRMMPSTEITLFPSCV